LNIYKDAQDEQDDEKEELLEKRMLAGDIVASLAGGDFLSKFATSRQTASEMGRKMSDIAIAAVEQIYSKIK
jgi:hypothetical protein